jgi:hypothetical protein
VQTLHHSTSMGTVWKEFQITNFWVHTSPQILHGPRTLLRQLRKHSRGFIFSESWNKTTYRRNFWCLFTVAPLKVCWRIAFLCGMPAVQQQTGEIFRELSTQPRKSLAAPCPLWRSYPALTASIKQPGYWRTHPIPDIICSTDCPRADVSGPSHHEQTDSKTVSTLEPFANWTPQNHLHKLLVARTTSAYCTVLKTNICTMLWIYQVHILKASLHYC